MDLSSKPASKSQWLNFNDLTKKAWEPCKEYFDEIKQIKVKNASREMRLLTILISLLIIIQTNGLILKI